MIDLALAALAPALILGAVSGALAVVANRYAPYQCEHYAWIDPVAVVPLVAAFLVAAIWSRWRPDHAWRVQLLPASASAVAIVVSVYLVWTINSVSAECAAV